MIVLAIIAAVAAQGSQIPPQYEGPWPPLRPLATESAPLASSTAPADVEGWPSAVAPGAYRDCILLEGEYASVPLEYLEGVLIRNDGTYNYLGQTGRFEFDDGQIRWLSGPLTGGASGAYGPDSAFAQMVVAFEPINFRGERHATDVRVACGVLYP